MEIPEIKGLKASRAADREKIFAAFKAVADAAGAELERRDEPAHRGWSGPAIEIRGKLAGVGFMLDIDDLHERQGQPGGLLSWYNAGIGRARNFSGDFNVAAGDFQPRPHHKASSIGDWAKILNRFAAALAVVNADKALIKEVEPA